MDLYQALNQQVSSPQVGGSGSSSPPIDLYSFLNDDATFLRATRRDVPSMTEGPPSSGSRLAIALERQRQRQAGSMGIGDEYGGATRIPFVGSIFKIYDAVTVRNSALRIKENKASDEDYEKVASYLVAGENKGKAGIISTIADSLLEVPALAIEFGLTGGAFTSGRTAATRAATSALGSAASGTAGRAAIAAAGFAGAGAAQAAALPHHVIGAAAERAIPEVGIDARGNAQVTDNGGLISHLPAAFADQAITLGILGSVSRLAIEAEGPLLSAAGLKRNASRIGTGMAAQQVADVVSSFVGLRSGYGIVGDVARGEFGDALKHSLSQATTFAAFGALHEPAVSGRIQNAWVSATQRFRRNGITEQAAGERLAQAGQVVNDVVARNPNATRADAEDMIARNVPRGPAFDYATAIAEGLPRTTEEAIKRNRKTTVSQLTGQQNEADPVFQRAFAEATRIGMDAESATEYATRVIQGTQAQEGEAGTRQPTPPSEPLQAQIPAETPQSALAGQNMGVPGQVRGPDATPQERLMMGVQPEAPPEPVPAAESRAPSVELTPELQAAWNERLAREGLPTTKTGLPQPGKHFGELTIPADVLSLIERTNLPERQRQSLEGLLSGNSLRALEETIGIGYQTIRKDARKAFDKLKETDPNAFPQYRNASEFMVDMMRGEAERLTEAGRSQSIERGQQVKQSKVREQQERLLAEIEGERNLYEEEIRRDNARLEQNDKLQGIPSERTATDVERASAEEVAAYRARRGGGKTSQRVEPTAEPGSGLGQRVAEIISQAQPEFGQPVTAAENRTLIGGGQPDAGPSKGRETALANAKIDADRKMRGEKPLFSEARSANAEVWDRAMERLSNDPKAAENLVFELANNPRATTIEENALLLHREVALRNEYARANIDAIKTYRDKSSTPEQLASADARVEAIRGDLEGLEVVIRKTGSEWGKAGQFRRQLVAEDFSLGSMLRQAEAAKKGSLSKEEAAKIAEQAATIKDLQDTLANMEKNLAGYNGGIGTPREITEARAKVKNAQAEFLKDMREYRDANKTKVQRIWGHFTEAMNFSRAIITSLDLSAILRQGGFTFFSRPLTAMQAVPESLRAFRSKESADVSLQSLHDRANGYLYKQTGLHLAEKGGSLGLKEEVYGSRWFERLPEIFGNLGAKVGAEPVGRAVGEALAGSERAYTTYLNRIRADVFDSMVDSLGKSGKVSLAEAQAIAEFVNTSTGRGKLGPFENGKAATVLSNIFFSPRYVMSRLQLLTGEPLWSGTNRTRAAIAMEYGKLLVGLGVMYGVARIVGDDKTLTFDPRSADFGKLRFGDTRVDPLFGLSQPIVLAARVTSGQTVNQDRQVIPLRGDGVKYGGRDVLDIMTAFTRSKLAPLPGTAINVATGRNVVGEPVTAQSTVADMAVPFAMRDIYETMTSKLGVPAATAISLLGILGMGVQTYKQRAPRSH